jgi:hypothetical protein
MPLRPTAREDLVLRALGSVVPAPGLLAARLADQLERVALHVDGLRVEVDRAVD